MTYTSHKVILLSATALGLVLAATGQVSSQDIDACAALENGAIEDQCVQANAGDVVTIPTGRQTEPEVTPITNDAGFSISLDGEPVDSDPTIEDQVRLVDLALADANVQVTFDGFDPTTRLAVETVGAPRAYAAGESVTLQSETNYPAFIARGEFRIIDRGAIGGPRLAGVVPVEANGQAVVTVPAGTDIVVVHRVYDARGRFDETDALPLGQADDRGLRSDVAELADTAAVQNIKVNGGAVTVYAENLASGATLQALGASARPDASGAAVIQRILPAGDYDVDVSVNHASQGTRLTRPVEVPGAEWFYVGVADLTWYQNGRTNQTNSETTGRLQYYVDGETAEGVQITSSLDTGEEELDEIFQRLDEKDPRSVLDRIDPEDSYPTFGDDSEIEDDTPTSGKFYLRIAKDDNFVVWGDYKSTVDGNTFVRNERSLYGAQAVVNSAASTADGEPRVSAEIYAAQPEQLVGRESFQGTGGSVYFLRRQDISPGTETLTVELRDADTGRVIDRQSLVPGRDYEINYLQGVITLTKPLTSSVNTNLVQTNPGGDQNVNLVAQYEFTPTTSDVDGFSYGGRVEGWVNDQLRLGLTATSDDTGTADQQALGFDARYQIGANSFIQLDWARSEGPGFDQDFSLDGGLTINGTSAADGTGEAVRLAAQADLRDLGYGRDGVVGGYFEKREEGFSSLDYQVTDATGDEQLSGAYARVAATDDALGYAVYADLYENDVGDEKTEVGAEVEGAISPDLSFKLGAEYLDETRGTVDGDRIDLAGRLTYAVNDTLSVYGFGQTTATADGLDDYDRAGVGVIAALTDEWSVEGEISDGTGGVGGRATANYSDGAGNSRYFGYELDTGRAVEAGVSRSDNGGKYILGGRQQVNDRVSLYGENTYDIFDRDRTLTSAYGLEYVATDFLTYDAAIEIGQVNSDDDGDLDRTALSFGMRYDDAALRASARVELRRDAAEEGSSHNDFDAIYFNANARYKIDEEQRLLLSFASANSDTDGSSVLDGRLIDASIGYAYRPILDERLNVLTRYRYLEDTFGQEIDGVEGSRAQQESHVFSLEGNYDLTRSWTIGGKIGGRLSETATTAGDPWVSNDAYLAVINARYHLVHNWDVLIEARHLNLVDAELSETGVLGAVYRHVGNNAKVGVGYNFSNFSDDLTDLSQDDEGAFINIIAKF
ncbi:MAG: hypothetical protein AAFQ64_21065 [Pseudomonadota bacterium]